MSSYLKSITLTAEERKYVVENHADKTIAQLCNELRMSTFKVVENLKLMELEAKPGSRGSRMSDKPVGVVLDESKYSNKGVFDIDKYFRAAYL